MNTAEVFIGDSAEPAASVTTTGTCEVTASTELVYTIEVCNDGGPASDVSVSDVIPTGRGFVSADPSATSASQVGADGTVTWDLGDIAANTCGSSPVTLTLTVSTL